MDVQIGDVVLMDIRAGVRPQTFQLKVISTTNSRFVAQGTVHGQPVAKTFRKADGRSVGSRYFSWARIAESRPKI